MRRNHVKPASTLSLLSVLCLLLILCPAGSARADVMVQTYNGIMMPKDLPSTDTTYSSAVTNAVVNHLPMPLPSWLATRPTAIKIDIGRQFFIPLTSGDPLPANPDNINREFLVDSMSNITRTYHYGNYWDSNNLTGGILNPYTDPTLTFSDGVWYDPSVGKYVLYTHLYSSDFSSQPSIGKYYSTDGIHWTRANHVLVTWSDIYFGVTNGEIADCDSSAFWLDQDANGTARWKSFLMWKGKGVGIMLESADGNYFGPVGKDFGAMGNQDRSTIFMNPFRKKGVFSIRGGATNADRMRDYIEYDPNIFCTSAMPGLPGGMPYWFGSDYLDPNSKYADPNLGYWHGLPTLYNFDATPYESMLIGMYSVHAAAYDVLEYTENRTDKANQVYLGFSYDGWYFHRPLDPVTQKHVPFCPLIPALNQVVDPSNRSWAGSNVQSVAGSPIIVGPADNEQLYFYASGRGLSYYGPFCIGMRYIRRDGFCSMDAGSTEGTVLTHPVNFTGKYMFVNVADNFGNLQVEAIDPATGLPIAPFTKANCRPIALDKTATPVTWNGAADLSALSNTNVQFKFYLTNGSLYSFWVTPSAAGASNGYVGGGGAHYTGNKDTVGAGPFNLPPVVTMPANVTMGFPGAATPGAVALNATVSDDGQTSPVVCTWSVLAAPTNGVVTITNANSASTTASFNRVGTYTLQLDANDGALHAAATMTVTTQEDPRADFDKNGVVDGLDFLTWQRNYNHGTAASGAPILDSNFSDPNYAKANGDANGDGKVDGQDFLIWQQDYVYGH